jgi:hypothetical protein
VGCHDARRIVTTAGLAATVDRMRHLLGFAVLAALAASAIPVAAAQHAGDKADAGIRDGSEQRRLTSARGAWKNGGVRSYSFRLTRACFCPAAQDIRIVVRRGRPAASTGEELLDVATVPRMFRRIQRSIDAKVAGLTVRYGKRGVPSSISIDGSRMVADDEIGYTIRRFTPQK